MRTTLDLDDALMSAAKREAARRGIMLAKVIEEALRAELARPREQPQFRLEFPVVCGGRPPLVEAADREALDDAMEDADLGA
jgi:hypothetical protein